MITIDDFDRDDFELQDFIESYESREKLKGEWKQDMFRFDSCKDKMSDHVLKEQNTDIIIIE